MIARLLQFVNPNLFFPRLRALLSLPGEISALRQQIWVLDQRTLELTLLAREILESTSLTPSTVPETDPEMMPDLPSSPSPLSGPQIAPLPPLRDPHRIRTDKDVHYTSQPLPRALGALHGDGRTR